MSPIATVVARVLAREGSTYTETPGDRGGSTKYGITVPFYSDVSGTPKTSGDVAALTEASAFAVYVSWLTTHRLAEIEEVHVLDAVVDFAVHSGVRPAVKALQRALDVPQDGVIGSVTLTALADADAPTVVRWLTGARIRKLGAILTSDPSQSVFARGWLNRVADVLEAQ